MKITTPAFLLLAASAFADEVILPSGARIRGDVREENDLVVVRLDVGTMSFPRSQVRIVRAASEPQRELDERTEKAATAQDFHDAAVFAKSKHLDRRVEDLHRRALELDPEHEGSRAALGYAKVDGRWLKGDALFAALGYVRRGAHFVTKETAQAIDARLGAEEVRRTEPAVEAPRPLVIQVPKELVELDEARFRAEEKWRVEDTRRANLAAEEAGKLERMRLGLGAALGFEQPALERRRLEIEREVALKTAGCALPMPYPTLPYPGAVYPVDRRGAGPPITGPR